MKLTGANPASRSSGGTLGLRTELWQMPLTSVCELIHSTSQTGQLRIETHLAGSALPLEIHFLRGEVTAASILDWRGLDALYSFPQTASTGWAEFWQRPVVSAPPLAPFLNLLGEWARLSDEWPRSCEQILSPAQRFYGEVAPFDRQGGASAHWVAAQSGQPLYDVCGQLAALQQAGFIRPIPDSFEWDRLVLPACQDQQALRQSPVLRLLDGHKTLRQLMERGVTPDELRAELPAYLVRMAPFPGSGRTLRDWLWEQDAVQSDLLMS
ncbi:hypothetical protein GCM10017783_14990 [Deinococcus piscis]|uniref:PatA-like N-terminal domain-containing protein n=1 Tax=Deinococcus piscis TaxID=394230 RepID=A0ABQ3K8E2_9DEIO|nr:DUF4388 domain-containing protein [Deinococcus piscis]GHG03549.1 hypothetical protein GCM10017783_14990 [Deinococcus piscis]